MVGLVQWFIPTFLAHLGGLERRRVVGWRPVWERSYLKQNKIKTKQIAS